MRGAWLKVEARKRKREVSVSWLDALPVGVLAGGWQRGSCRQRQWIVQRHLGKALTVIDLERRLLLRVTRWVGESQVNDDCDQCLHRRLVQKQAQVQAGLLQAYAARLLPRRLQRGERRGRERSVSPVDVNSQQRARKPTTHSLTHLALSPLPAHQRQCRPWRLEINEEEGIENNAPRQSLKRPTVDRAKPAKYTHQSHSRSDDRPSLYTTTNQAERVLLVRAHLSSRTRNTRDRTDCSTSR